jgi:hypothetical protein
MDIGQKELSAGDIASNMFRAWFDNFAPIFIVSVIFTVPIFIVNAVVVAGLPDAIEDADDFDFGNFFARTLGSSLVSVALSVVLTAALVYTFIKVYRGEAVTPGDAGRAVLDNIGPILIFAILSSILTAIGFVLLIIPGIMAVIAFSLGAPAILNEKTGGADAISRSFNLISGNWGVAIGVVLIGLVINVIVSLIVGGIAVSGSLSYPDFSDFNAFRALVQIAASALIAPIVPGLATALYFETKGRNEGFPSI